MLLIALKNKNKKEESQHSAEPALKSTEALIRCQLNYRVTQEKGWVDIHMDAAKENTGGKNYFTYQREEPAGGDDVHQVSGEKFFC